MDMDSNMRPDYQFSDFVQKVIDSFSGKSVVVENVAEESGFTDIFDEYNKIISIGENNDAVRPKYLLYKEVLTMTFPLVKQLCNVSLEMHDYVRDPTMRYRNEIIMQAKTFIRSLNDIEKLKQDIEKTKGNETTSDLSKNAIGLNKEMLVGEITRYISYVRDCASSFIRIEGIVHQLKDEDVKRMRRAYGSTFSTFKNRINDVLRITELNTQQDLLVLISAEYAFFYSLGQFLDIFENQANKIYTQTVVNAELGVEDPEYTGDDGSISAEERADREEFSKQIWKLNNEINDEAFESQAEVYAKIRDRATEQPKWTDELVKDYDELAQSKLSAVRFLLNGK